MTPNKLPPLPEPGDDDLPVPITYGMRKKGEINVIGVIPAKVHGHPPTSEWYLRDFEEVPLFTAEQLHAVREQAFHDGQCEVLHRQSQSLPAGAVAGLVGKWREKANEPAGTDKTDYDLGLEDCATDLEQALQADAREKGETDGSDGCTESNCDRCSTAPNARGDMRHAGIGSYPATQPAQASEKDNG